MEIKYILDASAALAVLASEPGHELVRPLLAEAAMSAVNAAEVLGRLIGLGATLEQAQVAFSALGTSVLDFTSQHAAGAAALVPGTTRHGLSLGDRACLATAQSLGWTAVTADRQWKIPGLAVKVQFVR